MALHIIMGRTAALLKELDAVTTDGDQVMFLGDGCYQLNRWSGKGKVFTSTTDIEVRGLALDHNDTNIESLSDEQWAAVIAAADKTVTW